MRFTKKGGRIDLEKTGQEVMEAIRSGVNYFDTAYIYAGSEGALGEILRQNDCRGEVKIATKLPQYLIKNRDSIEKCFREELRRLNTDYIDYYLMHMLTDVASWEKLKAMGIEEWIRGKKESGQIRNIGFSYHGNTEMFLRLVDAYDWDFCQIQYNYMDENSQAGRKGLHYAASKGIPVIIMEGLRGGRLADRMPENEQEFFRKEGMGRTPAEWALRWLWDQSEVTCVLSGMNSIEMVRENVRTASSASPGEFTEADFRFIGKVRDLIGENTKVGCTGCGYCQPCPQGVDIPLAFRCYNERFTDGKFTAMREYIQCGLLRKHPVIASRCVGCGKCEKHCPQNLHIRKELKNVEKELETPVFRLIGRFVRLFKLW